MNIVYTQALSALCSFLSFSAFLLLFSILLKDFYSVIKFHSLRIYRSLRYRPACVCVCGYWKLKIGSSFCSHKLIVIVTRHICVCVCVCVLYLLQV